MVGKEVIELVKIIAQHAVDTNRAFSAKAFARETMYNLVCALQLGNVAVLRQGYAMAKQASNQHQEGRI